MPLGSRRRALPVRRIERNDAEPPKEPEWPLTLEPVRALLDDGLDLGAVTVLVGDNGAGKSTVVEAVADAFGLNLEGGSTGARNRTFGSESALGERLTLVRDVGASRKGFFLRAETMHGFYTYLDEVNDAGGYHLKSHGESFIDLVMDRSLIRGLWLFDEPESALSLPGCLALLGLMRGLVENGSQIVLSTHSPVLAAYPGALLYELGDWGIRACDYDDLDLVRNWRGFMADPGRYLRHLG